MSASSGLIVASFVVVSLSCSHVRSDVALIEENPGALEWLSAGGWERLYAVRIGARVRSTENPESFWECTQDFSTFHACNVRGRRIGVGINAFKGDIRAVSVRVAYGSREHVCSAFREALATLSAQWGQPDELFDGDCSFERRRSCSSWPTKHGVATLLISEADTGSTSFHANVTVDSYSLCAVTQVAE